MEHGTTNSRAGAGRDLRARRERLGLSRYKLAALAEVSAAQIQAVEAGSVGPRSRVLAACRLTLARLEQDEGAA